MSITPPHEVPKEALSALNLLTAINKLMLKVFKTKKRQSLIFLILNDTYEIVTYDRAVLWSLDDNEPRLLGVSGQSAINTSSQIAKQWKLLVKDLKTPKKIQLINIEQFTHEQKQWEEYAQTSFKPSVLWVPIFSNNRLSLGLWLERWEGKAWTDKDGEIINFLAQTYGIAWENFSPRFFFSNHRTKFIWGMGLAALLLLFMIQVPLRIAAPCEVVPKDPYLVTAPLEDIIGEVLVNPGQVVKPGDILFQYDKRVALQALKIAENQVRVAQEDLTRAKTLAFKDAKSLAEVSVLEAKLKKEKANLELAQYRASQLVFNSPQPGIAMLEDPDQWRGKPVKVGEKILILFDPKKTKVRIWIPEDDNISLNLKEPIKVFLNINPTVTRQAKLNFVSNATTITEKHVVSFLAEADWMEPQKDAKVGLKGTAVLYGEKVSLFYWIMRKPWIYVRNLLGF